jgi:hypothetical protein
LRDKARSMLSNGKSPELIRRLRKVPMNLTTSATRLKQFGLTVCLREACTRVLQARLAALKTLFSQFGANPPNPVDLAAIDRAVEHFLKEERRRKRLLEALRR